MEAMMKGGHEGLVDKKNKEILKIYRNFLSGNNEENT